MNEKNIQNNLINNLQSYGWQYKPDIKNKRDVINNFRKKVNLRNQKVLKEAGTFELSDSEFERLFEKINSGFSFSDYQEVFLDDKHVIKLDNGNDVYLDIFSKNKDTNIFEIADEVVFTDEGDHNKRMDVLLLINGIPVINIELKKENVVLDEAINQLEEYSKRYTSIFKFIQILVASNNWQTKYFANNEKINRKFIFYYSNKKNERISELTTFVREFLATKTLQEYLTFYIINKREQKNLIALRGYQVHGVKAIIERLKEEKTYGSKGHGYLWHATGSGKTITSFKAAEIIASELPEYKKVIFLVDRKELDQQTINEYNLFLPSYKQLPTTTTTHALAKQMADTKATLIVSTIQKIDKFLKDAQGKYSKIIDDIKKGKMVFVFDEGHRSQAGDMNERIRKTFTNSRFIGFTGTPIFEDEVNNQEKYGVKSSLKMTTNHIFEKMLHSYLINNAIEDKNILPFNIQYYDNEKNVDVQQYLTGNETIKTIVENILDKFNLRSNNRRYSSLLIANDIDTAIKFYKEFKRKQNVLSQTNENYKSINIAITFSLEDGYSSRTVERREFMRGAVADFNKMTNSNESAETQKDIQKYQSRLQSIIRREDLEPEINLTIVVDRLLTGFDARKLNTLYVAKELRQHGLIQAFSRTNRVFDKDKVQGNIICYVPKMKKLVDEAIITYSNNINSSVIFRKNIEVYLDEAKKLIQMIEEINPEEIIKDPITNFNEGKKYISSVSKLSNVIRILNTMDDFNEKDIDEEFSMQSLEKMIGTAHYIKDVAGKEIEKTFEEKSNPYDEISLPINIIDVSIIDAKYIKERLRDSFSSLRKGNIDLSNQHLDELIGKLESTNHILLDKVIEFRDKLDKNPNLDFVNFFEDYILETEKKLKDSYEITKEEIEKQLDDYRFYSNYLHLSDIFRPRIKRLKELKELPFGERNREIKVILDNIKEKINSIRYSKEIIDE